MRNHPCAVAAVRSDVGNLLFLREFFRNWREVGFPLPSSRRAAQKVCELVDFVAGRSFIEIGPGTGSITRELLSFLHDDATLTALEVNRDFCRALRSVEDSRLKVHNVSAFQIRSVIREKVDCIISGIPIASMTNSEVWAYLQQVTQVLKPEGIFIQLQIAPVSYLTLRHFFREVKVAFTLRNTPPLFLYRCRTTLKN